MTDFPNEHDRLIELQIVEASGLSRDYDNEFMSLLGDLKLSDDPEHAKVFTAKHILDKLIKYRRARGGAYFRTYEERFKGHQDGTQLIAYDVNNNRAKLNVLVTEANTTLDTILRDLDMKRKEKLAKIKSDLVPIINKMSDLIDGKD